MTDERGPTGEHGRPLSDLWLHPVIPYGIAYSLAVLVNSEIIARVVAAQLGKVLDDFVVPPPLTCCAGMEPLLISWCFFKLRLRWQRAVELGTLGPAPSWWLAGIGIVVGCAVGLILASASMIPNRLLRGLVLIPITLVGPLPGVWWVMERKLRLPDPDYDDRMRPSAPADRERIELPNLAATESFGRRLGGLLFPNAIIALVGPLGAGKTQLSRAIAEGLGIANAAAVTSPTFTLIHEHPARLPIFHFDAYRLNGPNDFLDLGVTEYFEAGGVCLIEWADKVESALPAERLTIRIEVVDENRRKAELIPAGERYKALTTSVG
jgi:tRNA threonylcarbamoyladenosine biosynthesis protein TsaE